MGLRFALAAAAALLAVPLTVAPAAAAAQASAQPVVTHAFLLGRWTDTNDCSNSIDFLRDGSFVTSEGGRGRWTLENGRIGFHGSSSRIARIHATDSNNVILTHDDGSVGRSTRCQVPATQARRTMPPLPDTIDEALRISRPAAPNLIPGRWTDDGDCANAMTFQNNGTFTLPNGRGGRWTLVNERLSFIGQSTVIARVRAVGNDRIILIHDDRSLGQSIRC
jgi:hypothetical protein